MRRVVKAANRADSAWTMLLMVPALIMLFSAGMSMYRGEATPGEFTDAAQVTVQTFTDQYRPYVEATSGLIVSGVQKFMETTSNCASARSGGPIRMDAAHLEAQSQNCAFAGIAPSINLNPIKPYRGSY